MVTDRGIVRGLRGGRVGRHFVCHIAAPKAAVARCVRAKSGAAERLCKIAAGWSVFVAPMSKPRALHPSLLVTRSSVNPQIQNVI